jgi:proteasome lid subunit RPN8/RPN11
MAITLTPAVDAAIRAHGRETFPHECCGAMLGTDGVVSEAYALPNTTEEGPRRRFLVRPDDYRVAEKRAREAGSSGEAVAIRSRSCVAVVLLRDRVGDER